MGVENKGTFTQTPNVLLDTCKLPDETLMFFIRLYRHVGHKGGIFYGTVRKIANILNMSKSTVDRHVDKLEKAHMVFNGVLESEGSYVVMLHVDKVWTLNAAYNNGVEIAPWSDIDRALELLNLVPNLGRDEDEKPSDFVPNLGQVTPEMGQNVPNTGQLVLKMGHFVPHREREVGGNTTKTFNTTKNISNTEGANAPTANAVPPTSLFPPTEKKEEKPLKGKATKAPAKEPKTAYPTKEVMTLDTEEQIQFWNELWCKLWFNEIPPLLTPTAKGHVTTLAPLIKTKEQLTSLEKFARKEVEARGHNRKAIALGDLVSSYNRWKQATTTAPTSDDPSSIEFLPSEKLKKLSVPELEKIIMSLPLDIDDHSEMYKYYNNCIMYLRMPEEMARVQKQRRLLRAEARKAREQVAVAQ